MSKEKGIKRKEGRKNIRSKFFLTFIIITTIFSIIQYAFNIYTNFSEEIVQSLEEVTAQGVTSLQNNINGQINSIESVSKIIGNGIFSDNIDNKKIVSQLSVVAKDSDCKRMGFIDDKGIAYTTDGKSEDLSDRDYFHAGMNGQSRLSSVMNDRITAGEINVYSVPFYVNNEIRGVIFATFSEEVTQNMIEQTSFSGEGYSYIIKSDGTSVILSSNENSVKDMENLITAIRELDNKNEIAAQTFEENLKYNKSGYIVFKNQIDKYLYYMPVGINDWYLVTVVPQSVLHQKFDYVMFSTYVLCGAIILLSIIYLLHNKKTEEESRAVLENIVFVDELTKGISFNRFKKDARHILDDNKKELFAMIYVDVKHFRYINDVFGINEGDRVICYIYDTIHKWIGKNELISHISADHFAVLIQIETEAELEKRVIEICNQLRNNKEEYDIHCKFNISMGICFIEDNSIDVERFLEKAKSATKEIKDKHNRDYCIFGDDLQNKILIEKQIEDSMVEALEREEFVVYYQPKFSVDDKEIVGAEALVRWKDPIKGIMSPGIFIPIFERNGFIMELDTYVFERVCKDIREWIDNGMEVVPISINLSQIQFSNSEFIIEYLTIMKKYDVSSEYVQLELTESCLFDNVEGMLKVIDILHTNGVKILMDDFGKGYSSLNMLKNIPIDILKLDKTFIDDIGTTRSERIIENVISLAQSLDMKVVAEGVEEEVQYQFLYDIGCDEIQGYYFSKPVMKEEYLKFLK